MEKPVTPSREYLNNLSSIILNAAINVHREMGPGLLEGVYQQCMGKELQNRNLIVSSMVPVSLKYKGTSLNKDYIIDMLVENEIILELKAVDSLLPMHDAQIITCLKLADKRLGFFINFNVTLLKFGFRRFVNNF
jgi:GxxExxY protein